MKIICANNSSKLEFSKEAWNNIKIATQQEQELSPQEQLQTLKQKFPFIDEITMALSQNNVEQAKQIAKQNGVDWGMVQQMGLEIQKVAFQNTRNIKIATGISNTLSHYILSMMTPTYDDIKFNCPDCGGDLIWRCQSCRESAKDYTCTACNFQGP